MEIKSVQAETFERAFSIARENPVNEEERTVEVAFSSEEPYQRWFGYEILDHAPDAVRLGRLEAGGAVLVDHDLKDQVGVVESVRIDEDRRGRATLRFGKSQRADEIFQDVKDGIRRSISVGYRIDEIVQEGERDGVEVFRAIAWTPHEISVVSVPADYQQAGVGRNLNQKNEVSEMTEETQAPETQAAAIVTDNKIDVEQVRADVQKAEVERIREIEGIAQRFDRPEMAQDAIAGGVTADQFARTLLDQMGDTVRVADSADIGLTEKETEDFSFVRALAALAFPNDRKIQEAAGFERACSEAAAKASGKEAQGLMVPVDVLTRDLTVGTATAGGHTVSTDLLSGSFIDMLRNSSSVMPLATMLTGLNGNLAIPRQTGGATAYWVAESGSPTESQQAFDQVSLTPNTVGAFTDMSRKLLIQSSIDVEGFVRNDLARTIALELDRVGLNGSGASNQPEGVANVSGIGSADIGTNGGALTWAKAVELETDVAASNADVGRLAYITNSKVRGHAKTIERASGNGIYLMEGSDTMNGYPVIVSNQVLSNITKGTGTNLSQCFFGNWADLIIGLWSGLDLIVDPYTASTSGTVRIVALQDADVAVRHAESFSLIGDIDAN